MWEAIGLLVALAVGAIVVVSFLGFLYILAEGFKH